jgi:hypothetical protein
VKEVNVSIEVDDLGKKDQRRVVGKDSEDRLEDGSRRRPLKIVEIGLQIGGARVSGERGKNTEGSWEEGWGLKKEERMGEAKGKEETRSTARRHETHREIVSIM